MGLYGNHVLPHVINCACGMKAVRPLRKRAAEGLHIALAESAAAFAAWYRQQDELRRDR